MDFSSRGKMDFSYKTRTTGGECVSGMRSLSDASSRSGGNVTSSRLVSSRGSSPGIYMRIVTTQPSPQSPLKITKTFLKMNLENNITLEEITLP